MSIEITDEMVHAYAGEPEITGTDAHYIRNGLAAVLAIVERDWNMQPNPAGAAVGCQAETWSWEHFNQEQADGYWIVCDLRGPHHEHKDEHTGLTWFDKADQTSGSQPSGALS